MPYLVKVGYERKNTHLITSKGYFIKRSDTKIYTEWGAIDVIGLKRKKFCWHQNISSKVHRFRSVEKAIAFKNWKIDFLIRRGYNKLPPNSKIYRRRIIE